MFVLDPIGLAARPAGAGHLRRARPGRRRACSTSRSSRERRAAAARARERDEGRARGRVADQAAAAGAHRAQERRAVHGGRPVQLGRAVRGARPADGVLHGGAVDADLARSPLDRRARGAPSAVRGAAAPRARRSRASGSRGSRGVKQELLDFFVRQGISVSGEMVRVRQLGLCIDCKLCEEACEERYGARRLTLGGYQLGMLDFIYTCRTCTDQRCIDPCAYDSIKYDEVRKEVVINEATCTGCTACAQSCPYGAIDMVEIEPDAPTFKKRRSRQRLEKKDALKFGAGTGRVARARRIANKCDHCIAYGDQACVSACPTGSLIEINAYDLFRERSPAMAQLARTGFDDDLTKKRSPRGAAGDAVHRGRRHRSRRPREGQARPLRAAVDVADRPARVPASPPARSCCASTRRRCRTSISCSRSCRSIADIADARDPRAGRRIAPARACRSSCGLIGTGLMIIAAIYPIFRRIKLFRWLASNTMWFDFHLMAGTVGPMFIAAALGAQARHWVSARVLEHGDRRRSRASSAATSTRRCPELSSGRRARGARSRARVPDAAAALPVPMAEIDRELAEQRAEGAAGRDVAERAPRAVLAARRRTSAPVPARSLRAPRAGSSSSASTIARRARSSRAARRA